MSEFDGFFCRKCFGTNLYFYDGALGYEAVVCKDCDTHHENGLHNESHIIPLDRVTPAGQLIKDLKDLCKDDVMKEAIAKYFKGKEDGVDGNNINLKKDFQFFATPEKIADKLVYYADIQNHDTVLEPSAGQGAIIKAINKVSVPSPFCYELMEQNRLILSGLNLRYRLLGNDFLECNSGVYSKIIANPPFTKNQDIEHIYKMYGRLETGGRLVTIASNHWKISQNKKETNFRDWLNKNNAEIIEIDSGEFKESGTSISCCIIIINKVKA